MSNAMCHEVTLPKLLASLKRIFFIDPVGPSDTSVFDHILSMESLDDGFEFLLKTWSHGVYGNDDGVTQSAILEGLSAIHDLFTGRIFSVFFEIDPDLVKKLKLAEVRCEVLSGIVIKCTLLHIQNTAFIVSLTRWPPAFRQVFVHEISSSRLFTS
jgi:hypothetical protein